MRRTCGLVVAVARKDSLLFFADRRAALLCFAVPILLATAFGLIFDRPSERIGSAAPLRLAVVDEDGSPASRRLIEDIESGGRAECRVVTRSESDALIESRRFGVALILPHGFGDGTGRRVEVVHHPLSAMEGQWAEGVFTEAAVRRKVRDLLEPMGVEVSRVERPFAVERRSTGDGQRFHSYSHSFAGMTLQYLLFWGMESGLLLLRERRGGVWRRLRSSPIPLWALLAGRGLATAGIALMQVALTFGFGYVAFGVEVTGSPVGFAMLAVAVSVLAAATGLLVAAVGGTEARARSVCILVILTVSMLGGLWLPAFLLPGWVQELSLALPTTWAMRGLDGLTWQGYSLAMAWPSVLAVAGFAGLFLAVAVGRFTWSESRRERGWAS